jgi:hypothetical protein
VRRSDLPTVPVRELKRLKRSGAHTWGDGVPGQRSIRVPREYDRVSSAPVARGRQSHGAFLSARQNMISLMKKLRVTLKRTGNVVEFLKTMREGRFRSLMSRRQRQRCLVVWRL